MSPGVRVLDTPDLYAQLGNTEEEVRTHLVQIKAGIATYYKVTA